MRWKILATVSDGRGGLSVRATDGRRVTTMTMPAGSTPTDDDFDRDFDFALMKHRAKRGTHLVVVA
jgi:hypothetical protein